MKVKIKFETNSSLVKELQQARSELMQSIRNFKRIREDIKHDFGWNGITLGQGDSQIAFDVDMGEEFGEQIFELEQLTKEVINKAMALENKMDLILQLKTDNKGSKHS